jgi:hypothetical protein
VFAMTHWFLRQPFVDVVTVPWSVVLVLGILFVDMRRVYDVVASWSESTTDGSYECLRMVGKG